MRRMRSLLFSIGLAVALAGLTLAPVAASYPGHHNGRITFGIRGADGANIFSILPNGKGQKQLTKGPGFHLCPSYSADGRMIAYCSNVSGAWEIWTMRAPSTRIDAPSRTTPHCLPTRHTRLPWTCTPNTCRRSSHVKAACR